MRIGVCMLCVCVHSCLYVCLVVCLRGRYGARHIWPLLFSTLQPLWDRMWSHTHTAMRRTDLFFFYRFEKTIEIYMHAAFVFGYLFVMESQLVCRWYYLYLVNTSRPFDASSVYTCIIVYICIYYIVHQLMTYTLILWAMPSFSGRQMNELLTWFM